MAAPAPRPSVPPQDRAPCRAVSAALAAGGPASSGAAGTARARTPPPAAAAGRGRIGPNAILQLLPVIDRALGPAARARLLAAAGLAGPPAPDGMIPEDDARRLHLALRALHPQAAPALAAEAGAATAAYILAHRLPRPVQRVLRNLPAPLAAALLARAIARHAWTFAGSGRFRLVSALPPIFELADNPLVQGLATDGPVCDWHRAVFEGLFRSLAGPRWQVRETACSAAGADACRFELHRTRSRGGGS